MLLEARWSTRRQLFLCHFLLYQSFLFHCLCLLRIEISSLRILLCNYFYFYSSSSIRNVTLIAFLRRSKHSVATFYSDLLRLRFRSKAYFRLFHVSHRREIFWLRETRYKEVLRRFYVVKLLPFDFPRRYIVRRSIFPRTKLWSNDRITVARGKWRARLVPSSLSIVRCIIRKPTDNFTLAHVRRKTKRYRTHRYRLSRSRFRIMKFETRCRVVG